MLAIAVGAGPLYAVGVLVPLAVGYAIPRWWLLAVPIPLALLAGSILPDPCEGGDSDCEATGLQWLVLLGAAVIAMVGLALGVAMRKLYRRASTPA